MRISQVRKGHFDGIECSQLHHDPELIKIYTDRNETVPTTSISMTDLKAFSDIPDIGARKLPAAPETDIYRQKGWLERTDLRTAYHEINLSKLRDCVCYGSLEFLWFTDVRWCSEAGSSCCFGKIFRGFIEPLKAMTGEE
jgi:hypothetical protein